MRLVLVCAALSLLSLGCERTRVSVITDGGPACGAGERLVNGQCRVVCSRDGDCPSGERCDLLLGECVPRPAPVDAGTATTPCTEGAFRCAVDRTALQRCDARGSFVTVEQCRAPDGYCENERCVACRPGSTRCTGNNGAVEICTADGAGYRTVTCASGASCVSGECRQCTVGQRRCNAAGTTLEECQRLPREDLATGFVAAGDNFDGSCITGVCEAGAAGAQCRAPACVPGATQCLNTATQQVCSLTGAWQNQACTALPGMGPTAQCLNGTCVDECADAVRAKSYFGCEYWSAVLDNSMDSLFKGGTASGQGTADSDFVFVVTNQSTQAATVEVWRHVGAAPVKVKTVTVPGKNDAATKGLVKIPVPWQSITPAAAATGTALTGRARYAYRLTSTRPVTVYQFNPVDALKVTSTTCTADVGATDCDCDEYSAFTCTLSFLGSCLSCDPNAAGVCVQTGAGKRCGYATYSNDASLLLPAHILGTGYVGVTPGHSHINAPPDQTPRSSQLVIVAPQDNTTVTVKASAVTLAGTGIPAMAVGEERAFVLQSYEVLALSSATAGADLECQNYLGGDSWCRKGNDLTGTIVTADKPVAVFGSNPCLNVPLGRAACDHVEEQLFPFATWGKNFVAAPSMPYRLNDESIPATATVPDHVKIVAGAAATLTLTPAPAAGDVLAPNRCQGTTSLSANTCQLPGGAAIEFKLRQPTVIRATGPISVAQFLPGQGSSTGAATDPQQGDPSMILLPPIEQWRSQYTVLASTGLKDNYLALAVDGARVQAIAVDGVAVPLTSFAQIPNTSFRVRNHPVSTGTHTIQVTPLQGQTSLPGAGVTVYGYDAYVSYGYTGGLDLTTIVTGVNPGG